MNAKRILIPLDLLHSTSDSLLYLQRMAAEGPFSATLLYVVELNIALPDNRVYREIFAEAETALRRLVLFFFGNEHAAGIRVRAGRADEEILAEARASQADLIIMSGSKSRRWGRLFRPGTVESVMRAAPCPTLMLPRAWKANPAGEQPSVRHEQSPVGAAMRATLATAA